MPKGYSEPLILKALLKSAMTIAQIEKNTRIRRPTIYLSIDRLRKRGLVKAGEGKRNRKWMLTPRGRTMALNRIKGERIVSRIVPALRRALSSGVTLREIERAIFSKKK